MTDQSDTADSTYSASRTSWLAERFNDLVANVELFIRGKHDLVRMALVCMLAEGHLLIDDVPGTGKTSLAKAISQSIDGSMRRIQFTPDLLPSDVCGVMIWNAGERQFEFHPGGVFANIVLADEINRASPKTQSALLEVMAERQVTVDSRPFKVDAPFIVIATQNPVEYGGTYDLPFAQLDRFLMKTGVKYPDHASEMQIVANVTAGKSTDQLKPVMTADQLSEMIAIVGKVHIAEAIRSYIVTICSSTRTMPELRLGVSPRGSVQLGKAAQAYAAAAGRSFVSPDDIKAVAPFVLPHRMILRPEAELQGKSAEALLDELLMAIPAPSQRVGV